MPTIDIVILVLFLLGVFSGIREGFIKQLASLLGLVVGLLAAKALYLTVAERIAPLVGESPTFAKVSAFILIWLAVPLAFSLIASLFTKAIEAAQLGWINRWLGAGLGAIKALIAMSLLICIIEWIDKPGDLLLSKEIKQESKFYYPMEQMAGVFLPAAAEWATKE